MYQNLSIPGSNLNELQKFGCFHSYSTLNAQLGDALVFQIYQIIDFIQFYYGDTMTNGYVTVSYDQEVLLLVLITVDV